MKPIRTVAELEKIVEERLVQGLPCTIEAVKEAAGGGSRDRIHRAIRTVQSQRQGAARVDANVDTEIAKPGMPRQIEQRLSALASDIVDALDRVRSVERASTASMIEQQHRDAHAREMALASEIELERSEVIALATALDRAEAEVARTVLQCAQLQARIDEQALSLAAAYARIERAEHRAAETTTALQASQNLAAELQHRLDQACFQAAFTSNGLQH